MSDASSREQSANEPDRAGDMPERDGSAAPGEQPSTINWAMRERASRTVGGASEGVSDVAVLVPAAGAGTRMESDTRKQFLELGGESLLVCTLRAFERCDAVGHLVVAVPGREVSSVSDRLQAAQLRKLTAVVEGGSTRQDSVRNALRAVPKSVRFTLVHDAVRPFIDSERITAVVDAVRAVGAASLAVPVADTLRRGTETGADGTTFGATVDRNGLFRMQTPQGFRRDWLEAAHRQARQEGVVGTDDVELVQHLGHPVAYVEGSAYNFKVTTPTDWTLATALWDTWTETQT